MKIKQGVPEHTETSEFHLQTAGDTHLPQFNTQTHHLSHYLTP